jgi:sec-independent protein translocase protein TatC
MSLGEHLEELRRRILYALAGPVIGFIVCFFFFRNDLLGLIINPVYPTWELFGHKILVIEPVSISFTLRAPYSAFTNTMMISLIAGCILTAPWSLYQLWSFIAVGLRDNEKHWVHIVTPFSALLFALGAVFFYFVVYPVVLTFLYNFGEGLVGPNGERVITGATLFDGYVGFVMLLVLVFGLMFELPLVVFFLGKARLVSAATFRKYRRHVILSIVALSAMVTPPDIFSQLALALPMAILYEIGILAVVLTERGQPKDEDA